MPLLETDLGHTFYEVWQIDDTSPWVTLINGYTRSSSDFRSFAKFLNKEGYNAVSLDNRGCGQSVNYTHFDFNDFLDDIVNVWENLDIGTSHILGISMGGAIAQAITTRSPNKVLKVVLVSTFLKPKTLEKNSWSNTIPGIESQLLPYFSDAFKTKNSVLIRGMAKQIFKSNGDGSFSKGSMLQKKALLDFYSKGFTPVISHDCIVVHGKKDQIIPIDEAFSLFKQISNS